MYVDLLGVLQWAGAHINAGSYVSMDYGIHVLLRYWRAFFRLRFENQITPSTF
jgi:hypothetical protein